MCCGPEHLGVRVTGRLALLAGAMRAAGARVGVHELIRAHRALAAVHAYDPEQARIALRCVLCSGQGDLAIFDAAFELWLGSPIADARPELVASATPAAPSTPGPPPVESSRWATPDRQRALAAWSDAELLRHKDFAEYSDEERRLVRGMMRQLAERAPSRPSRRTRPAHHRTPSNGSRLDLPRTLRASLRHGGELRERRWREPLEAPRPLVFVCDVSGSMEPYARVLLQYMQACVAARQRVEAFVFGTRLTRVTLELRARDLDRALGLVAGAAPDWSGGTRIGAALATLNREHGRRLGLAAVVVLLSDGWDRGDPRLLAAETARLARCSHRLVWLNPLKAHPEYEPLTRGMRAALPHVDEFMAGNSLASLEELARLLETLPAIGRADGRGWVRTRA